MRMKSSTIKNTAYGHYVVDFYDANGSVLYTHTSETLSDKEGKYVGFKHNEDFLVDGVTKIITRRQGNNYASYQQYEVEFFGEYLDYEFESVANVRIDNLKHKSGTLKYTNPSRHVVGNEIYLDGKSVYEGAAVNSYELTGLTEKTTYEIEILTVYQNGTKVSFKYNFTTPDKPKDKPNDVTDFKVYEEDGKAKISYQMDNTAEYVKIYRDNKLIADKYKESDFVDSDVVEGKEYTYKVIAVMESLESLGVSMKIKMSTKEISSLTATPKPDRVDLKWTLPTNEEVSHVVIYRTDMSVNAVSRMFKSVFSKEEPLFETNGTYFNDLTVKSNNKYRYRVASVLNGTETTGISIEVTTPKITVDDGKVEKDENGDYTVTWSKPTKGKIKVYVGGKLYATVDAALKKYTIPAKDMKYTPLGAPDIKIVPVNEDGTEGEGSLPGGSLPPITGIFDGNDLLKAGVQLLAVIGGFLLLALAFRVVPKLVKTIRTAFEARSNIQGGKRRVQD